MFGFRPDGRRVSSIDPIVGITPYLMPMRCDAQVFLQHRVDYELLTRYIAAQAAKGEKITFMQIITAAFVRTVAQHPEINRFILNKQFFARNMCAVSFTMLKNPQNAEMGETAVKVKYDLTDTIYDVRDRMEKVINANRGEDKKNFADKLAKAVLVVPGLATGIVALVRLLDRYGLCPGALLDELPFHTSMYITNNASIGLHHGYPQQEDEYLTKNSEQFHRHLGFETVGTFHHCGYKFGRWYDMIWMEKMIGSHDSVQQSVFFPERKAYTITEIVEDDFGCEGRPEGAEPMVTVSLDGDHGVWGKVRIADAYLYEHHLDVGSVVHTTEMFLDSISVRP